MAAPETEDAGKAVADDHLPGSERPMASAGVAVDECIILPRGTLPKTPSGKIQRFRCRDLVASGSLPDTADVGL